jgi:hypothetical protein
VTADNAGIKPGVLVGDVLVASNAGKGETQLKSVRLATSAYSKGCRRRRIGPRRCRRLLLVA